MTRTLQFRLALAIASLALGLLGAMSQPATAGTSERVIQGFTLEGVALIGRDYWALLALEGENVPRVVQVGDSVPGGRILSADSDSVTLDLVDDEPIELSLYPEPESDDQASTPAYEGAPITLAAMRQPLSSLLADLEAVAGRTIQLDPGADVTVTLAASERSWSASLNELLDTHGLGLVESDGALRIGSRASLGLDEGTGASVRMEMWGTDLRDVLRLFADVSGLNVVFPDTLSGDVYLRVEDVAWDRALELILQGEGLTMDRQGNVAWFGRPDDRLPRAPPLPQEPLLTIDVHGATADGLARLLARATGARVAAEAGLMRSLSIRLVEVPPDRALALILGKHGLTWALDGDVVRITQR